MSNEEDFRIGTIRKLILTIKMRHEISETIIKGLKILIFTELTERK